MFEIVYGCLFDKEVFDVIIEKRIKNFKFLNKEKKYYYESGLNSAITTTFNCKNEINVFFFKQNEIIIHILDIDLNLYKEGKNIITKKEKKKISNILKNMGLDKKYKEIGWFLIN